MSDLPPPPPPIKLRPAWGQYGEFPTCEWCWRPAGRVGLFGVNGYLTIRRVDADLHFCDDICLELFRDNDETARASLKPMPGAVQ